jgi:hypothetical protein
MGAGAPIMNTEDRKRLMRMSENELRAEVARLRRSGTRRTPGPSKTRLT